MTDINDFMFDRPVPKPPVKVERDPTMEAFGEETQRVPFTPTSRVKKTGLRLDSTVTQQPCRAGNCRHPPGTQCGSVRWEPDPELDEIGVGWTAQHIPGHQDPVLARCIFCWDEMEHPELHDCQVLAVLQWTAVATG